jgi:hypothetical protein
MIFDIESLRESSLYVRVLDETGKPLREGQQILRFFVLVKSVSTIY